MKKSIWWAFAVLCMLIGLYPFTYLLIDEKIGLLSTKPEALLANASWQVGFYVHIFLGGIALLVGWAQFSQKWRSKRPDLHRLIGKIYIFCVLLSALAGIFIGLDATGGLVSQIGFVSLGVTWFSTTSLAFFQIRKGSILLHQKLMIFSYAACFAAVTLRLWLPLLVIAHKGNFEPAYRIVAWLCWVPNMLVAWWLSRRVV